ncbi:hypothetical protein AVEN_214837-1 [Araneus ventricosus]|uniref:Uncharacterized protein n=1 Tax=Araneus ventricosus TaxID=182803 RepID=A0A4Y2R3B4_ARAVE|nr:hypothetical protein AVEN_214837-1 [Araneus ventricosus]
MYRSFQNETNPLPKLWIRISDSESESVIPNPRNQSEYNSDSRIRFREFIRNRLREIVPFGRNRIWCFLLKILILEIVPERTTFYLGAANLTIKKSNILGLKWK